MVHNCYKNYATFSGRVRRKEYWYFVLFNLIFYLALIFVDYLLGTLSGKGVGLFSTLFNLAMLIPTLAVTARRFHDTNHSAWWLLLCLLPLIGPILILYFAAQGGEPEANQFGAPTKASEAEPVSA